MIRACSLLIVLLMLAPPLAAREGERAEEMFDRFVPPCCYTGLLGDHQSKAAEEMKEEIRTLLAEGKTEQEIVDIYVARYGERILSEPPSRGFNRLAILAPAVLLIAGFFLLVALIRRERGRAREAPPPSRMGIDPDLDSEIEREIREETQ